MKKKNIIKGVTLMNTNNKAPVTLEPKQENVLAGAVGAFLFSLAGGLAWFGLYQIGFLAGISGILGIICALKGYAIFAKKESIKGVVISVIMTVIVLIIAWYLCVALDVCEAYKMWYEQGEVDFTLTYGESVAVAYLFLFDSATWGYWLDLLIGLAFCAFGIIPNVKQAIAKAKMEASPMTDIPEMTVSSEETSEENVETTAEATETAEAVENETV